MTLFEETYLSMNLKTRDHQILPTHVLCPMDSVMVQKPFFHLGFLGISSRYMKDNVGTSLAMTKNEMSATIKGS